MKRSEKNELEIITVKKSNEKSVINISENLNGEQKCDVENLSVEFSDVFYESSVFTESAVYSSRLTSYEPFRSKVYPVPVHLLAAFDEEVDINIMHITASHEVAFKSR